MNKNRHDGWLPAPGSKLPAPSFQHTFANTKWQFQTQLTLYDAKSHFPLWTLTQPVRPANLRGTWRKNIADANAAPAGDLKSLLSPTP